MTASPDALALVAVAARAAADKLADDIVAFDVSEKLVITDAFLVCSAANDRQVVSIVDEIEEYVSLGLSRHAALQSATGAGARSADGLSVGSIEEGCAGDLLIVDADPLADLAALRTPRAVVVGGRQVDLAWIDRTLDHYANTR